MYFSLLKDYRIMTCSVASGLYVWTCCQLCDGPAVSSVMWDIAHSRDASAAQCLVSLCTRAADNVGDNVGDIAGMGADLFGSFAEATCAALVISSVSTLGTEHVNVAMCYPLLISAVGILVCLLTTLIATDLKPARGIHEIESTLKMQLVISTVLATPVSLLPALIQFPRT